MPSGSEGALPDWGAVWSREPPPSTVAPMPEPGDPCPGFIVQPGECWQMIYDRNLQATHCRQDPRWTGGWFRPQLTAGGVCGPVPSTSMA